MSLSSPHQNDKNNQIDDETSIFIIAEIGINHNGNLEIAKDLIDVAFDSGADAVKFQKRTIDLVYDQDMLDSPRESPWGTTQREQKEGLEFGLYEYQVIYEYCQRKKLNGLHQHGI